MAAPDMTGAQDMSKRQGLITVNDLNYVLEPDLSVATNKTHKKHFFQSSSYEHGQQGICILNSGADYIDTRRSFLSFELSGTHTATRTYTLGSLGTACNLIKNITISTRSGDELCRITDYNALQHMILPLTYDEEWFQTTGQLMGQGKRIRKGAGNTVTHRFIIPMYVLSPLFAYGRLLPAMLMSGMRIEIEWEDKIKPFFATTEDVAADNTNVRDLSTSDGQLTTTIKDPYFSLASVQLSDSIQRALNELSATNGLEVVYCDWERTTIDNRTDLATVNIEVRKSCSRALKAFARVRATGGAAADTTPMPDSKKDSFRAEQEFPFTEYQWQLGSLYFPQQPVKAATAYDCGIEAYAHTLEAADKFHGDARQPLLSLHGGGIAHGAQFASQLAGGADNDPYELKAVVAVNAATDFGTHGSYMFDSHVLGVTLERSTMFNLAGVPVNNSRVLSLRAKLQTAKSGEVRADTGAPITTGATYRKIDVFLKYVKLARVFLNNVEVEQ